MNREPSVDERSAECVPRFDLLVSEHHGQHTTVLEDTLHLAKASLHLPLIILLRELFLLGSHLGEAGGIRHCLIVLVGVLVSKEIIVALTNRAFQPDIEIVAALSVVNIV